jgi:hypothetical protein
MEKKKRKSVKWILGLLIWNKNSGKKMLEKGLRNSLFIILFQVGQKLVFSFRRFPVTKPAELNKLLC